MIKSVAKTYSTFAVIAMLSLGFTPSLSHASRNIATEEEKAEFSKTLREIGLREYQIQTINQTYLSWTKREKALPVARWLKDQGIQDVPNFITNNPRVLDYSIERNLQFKVNWLAEQGVKDIGAFLSLFPPFLGLDLEGNIKVKAEWLKKQGVKDVGKVISLYPQFFGNPIKTKLQPRIKWLQDQGITDVVKVISQAPSIFGQSNKNLNDKIKWLVKNGVTNVNEVITTFPAILTYSPATKYEPMANWLRAHGVKNVGKVISDFPSILGISLKHLDKKFQWLEDHKVPNLAKVIESFPNILGSSIEDCYEQIFPWIEKQGIKNPGELLSRYPQLIGLNIEENLDPKMTEYRNIWKMSTEELEKTPIYFGSSLKRVQELRDFLNEIAKMAGAESFDFARLTEIQRRKLIQNLSGDIILGYLKDVKVIAPSRKSLAELTSQERALLARLYKTNQLSRFFVWKNEFYKESKQVELGCIFGTIKRGLKTR